MEVKATRAASSSMSAPVETVNPINQGLLIACDAMGEFIQFWGFKRALGRVWTLLYLSARPLTAEEIGRALKLSSGAASMALNEMEHWGIAHRELQPGRRVHFYRCETHFWKMITRVIRHREIHQLDRLIYGLKEAIAGLEGIDGSRSDRGLAIQRLKRLLSFVEVGTEAVKILFQEKTLDRHAFQKLLQIRSMFSV